MSFLSAIGAAFLDGVKSPEAPGRRPPFVGVPVV